MYLPLANRFKLNTTTRDNILNKTPKFGYEGFSEIVFFDHYSRLKENGNKETWNDVIIRCVEGTYSILKNHYKKNFLPWDENYYQEHAKGFSEYMFDMKFLPGGRGIYCMGTEFLYDSGAMCVNNCAAITTKNLVEGTCWLFDASMYGTGVGFDTIWKGKLYLPNNYNLFTKLNEYDSEITHVVEDSREGWVESYKVLVEAFMQPNQILPKFDYSKIRAKGIPLKRFGGISSGYEPLYILHQRILGYLSCYYLTQEHDIDDVPIEELSQETKSCHKEANILLIKYLQAIENFTDDEINEWSEIPNKTYGSVRLVADICNSIGAAVVAGNIRRSAEIAFTDAGKAEFYKLKDYTVNPERRNIMWLSNNTIVLKKKEDFSTQIPLMANQLQLNNNGEPGIYNLLNTQRYGRVGAYRDPAEPFSRAFEEDKATLGNPCLEIPLEPFELCCLVEIFITRCLVDDKFDIDVFNKACEYASFYAMCVSIFPTHSSLTNAVIAKNHRLGISISGAIVLPEKLGYSGTISVLSNGYKKCRKYLKELSSTYGICEPIRITTVKPSGTISLLVGSPPGCHYNICGRYVIRRKRVGDNNPIVKYLIDAGYNYEVDIFDKNRLVFDFPIDQGNYPSENDVNVYDQLTIVKLLQTRWSDNSTSVTIKYNKEEGKHLEKIISSIIPDIKTLSFLPKSDITYQQAPYEAITEEKYQELIKNIKDLDLSKLYINDKNDDVEMPKYCDNDKCVL